MKELRFLIVDDDVLTGRLIKNVVSEFGSCDQKSTGKDAVDSFKHAYNEGNPYDLVFLDILMPDMNGQMVLKTMREYEAELGDVGEKGCRIIMLSSSREPQDVIETYKNQCDGFITKPMTKNQVQQLLRQNQPKP